ncbi:hypothetical protein IWQ60_006652 [Tieghemiomyces parasiticus]|uniref:Uncharacterized protein n=1 Tax=Tieghemiomyces parasiticus TaxID=78921 RepID=A0A9W8A633_9FUNG|nr:hypothetical protein IWQ60_006652 [Tieghemiomyces parasiticus]
MKFHHLIPVQAAFFLAVRAMPMEHASATPADVDRITMNFLAKLYAKRATDFEPQPAEFKLALMASHRESSIMCTRLQPPTDDDSDNESVPDIDSDDEGSDNDSEDEEEPNRPGQILFGGTYEFPNIPALRSTIQNFVTPLVLRHLYDNYRKQIKELANRVNYKDGKYLDFASLFSDEKIGGRLQRVMEKALADFHVVEVKGDCLIDAASTETDSTPRLVNNLIKAAASGNQWKLMTNIIKHPTTEKLLRDDLKLVVPPADLAMMHDSEVTFTAYSLYQRGGTVDEKQIRDHLSLSQDQKVTAFLDNFVGYVLHYLYKLTRDALSHNDDRDALNKFTASLKFA